MKIIANDVTHLFKLLKCFMFNLTLMTYKSYERGQVCET